MRYLSCGDCIYPFCIELADALPFYIDACILIAGDGLSAVRADPLFLAKLQLAEVTIAEATGFAGGIPLVNVDEMLTLLLQLVFEGSAEHAKPVVHSGFPQVECLRHAPQINVLHAHGSVGVGYPPALLVDEVLSLIGDMLLEYLYPVQLLVVVL